MTEAGRNRGRPLTTTPFSLTGSKVFEAWFLTGFFSFLFRFRLVDFHEINISKTFNPYVETNPAPELR